LNIAISLNAADTFISLPFCHFFSSRRATKKSLE
jgi:hypothetical protein